MSIAEPAIADIGTIAIAIIASVLPLALPMSEDNERLRRCPVDLSPMVLVPLDA